MAVVKGAYDVLDELYSAFRMMDITGDGKVDFEELHKNFKRELGGKQVPKEWVDDRMKANDVSTDGVLSFSEFCKMETDVFDQRLDAVKSEYESFLASGAGIVSSTQLVKTYMARAKQEKKEREVKAAFEAAGMLQSDFEVPFSIFFKLSTGMPIDAHTEVGKTGKHKKTQRPQRLQRQWTEMEIREEFAKIDTDSSGFLSRKEVKKGLKDLDIKISIPQLNRMLTDGQVDYEEFRKIVSDHGGVVQTNPVLNSTPLTSPTGPRKLGEQPPAQRTSLVYTHATPTDESTLTQMIEDGIYQMRNFTPQELADWLLTHCGERFELFRTAFLKHNITGEMFRYLTEDHLEEMSPITSIGDRLYMMNVRHKVTRAERIARRQHVILQGRGFMSPPGVWTTYVLTNESLKITFVDAVKNRDETNPYKVKSHISKKIDHIDLITVLDVDIETTVDTEATYEEVPRERGGNSRLGRWASKQDTEIVKRVSEMNTAKLHFKIENKEPLALVIPSAEVGKELHTKLVDAIEEVQHMHHLSFV